ncbi:GntR family transcriptional regulator [Pandoraea terrae]|uniref:GntR family transcriptional regulator n=1 Tax=Pandoraea terrae TaxID=1537710 RepID=A0A5E4XTS9_9BURK|nr:GntR family transcriptional regulator [Pandoraea terrae]VVE39807.1 GntR family transcriptional regulator [Pandoraea terrae]
MPTIAARIYKSLADQIIDGTLQPGEKLDERVVAERFEVSRTPIREALRELGARGLVEVVPRRGVVVAKIGAERLSVLLEADCELEALCARRAAECMTAMEKKELEFLHEQSANLVAADDIDGYLEVNRQFHSLICAGAHNDVIATMVADLRERLAPFRQAQSQIEDRFAVSHAEHQAVVAAILASDSEAAYNAMRSHNARLSTTVLRLIKNRDSASRN